MVGYFNDTQKFVDKCKVIHNDFYDYSLVNYKSYNKPVDIICPIHGVFSQKPTDHKDKKRGCQKCGLEKSTLNKNSTKSFIDKSNLKHLNKYDYSITDYKNARDFVDIICPKHGKFRQLAALVLKYKYGTKVHFTIIFKEIERFGGKVKLDYHIKNDNIKNKFCIDNNIRLFRIKYNQNIDIEMTKIINYLWQK